MDKFQKYSRLLLLLVVGFMGFLLLVALLIFILRLFSITLFHIPGFDLFFQYVIIIIPYLIFFAAYYYLFQKIKGSKSRFSRISARVLIASGCLICLFTLSIATTVFLKVKHDWLRAFDNNSHYALIIQLVILFLTAGILASGDAREKDWMERKEDWEIRNN